MLTTFSPNSSGRDFVVGDIQGCFTRLEQTLSAVDFDRSIDRLFAVGDLAGDGPDSTQVLDYLSEPWFHSVRGDREQTIINLYSGQVSQEQCTRDGGGWFLALSAQERERYVRAFINLPNVIELEHSAGAVGIVHADCPVAHWGEFCAALPSSTRLQHQSMRNGTRIVDFNVERITGIRAVVVGHIPLSAPVVLGNVYHIDTTPISSRGHFTLLEVGDTLDLHEPGRLRPNSSPSFAR